MLRCFSLPGVTFLFLTLAFLLNHII